MGIYFDYSDWKIEELTNSIRERITEAKTPLPKKVMKHFICIRYRTGERCYSYGGGNEWIWNHPEFKTREDAVKYIDKLGWVERIGDNMWVDSYSTDTYKDKDGNEVPCHYVIDEYDTEVYEDGDYHIVYTDEERKYLSEALHCIEKARAYMRAYDYASGKCGFGEGSYAETTSKELEKFENEYTEELPDDYYEEE